MGNSRQLARASVVLLGLAVALVSMRSQPWWSAAERDVLRSLWIGSLPPAPLDPSNRVADDGRAAELGRRLFFDSRLSANGYVSCATCHRPDQGFQDGLPLGKGVRLTKRRTQMLVGAAYSTVLFWDGRKDSLWAQALEPLESPTEHGGHRFRYARTIAYHYASAYEEIFGALPAVDWTADWRALSVAQRAAVTRVFVNMGKAIAAYERTFSPRPTRFDAYVEAVLNGESSAPAILADDEVAGLKLFIDSAGCVRCHNTPLFTDHQLHNTGVPPGQAPDRGWADGWPMMLVDEFGCRGPWSDADPAAGQCPDHQHPGVGAEPQVGAFKTPSLRLVANRPPYMHAGQCATLADVLRHYSTAPPAALGRSEIEPRHFSSAETRQLTAFLQALSD